MTVAKLHKILGAAIEAGHGRKGVCVNKRTFHNPLEEDGAVIIPVTAASIETYELLDDDGGWALHADGTQITRTSLVLLGEEATR